MEFKKTSKEAHPRICRNGWTKTKGSQPLDSTDDGALKKGRTPQSLQVAKTNRRAGFWKYQICTRLPPIPTSGNRKGHRRVELAMHGPQFNETGGSEWVKPGRSSFGYSAKDYQNGHLRSDLANVLGSLS